MRGKRGDNLWANYLVRTLLLTLQRLIGQKSVQEAREAFLGRRTNKVLWKPLGMAEPLK